MSEEAAAIVCSECGEELPTKNKLFQHLQNVHSLERDSSFIKPPKVSLVMGWLSNDAEEENDWMEGGFLRRGYTDDMETALWKAVDTVENITEGFGECPKGFSRGNGSAQRASHLLQSEATCHAVGDLFCFCLKKLGPPKDMRWVERINAELPSHMRALEVYNMPTKFSEFHAEQNCSQRVFEYIIPLSALFDTNLDDTLEIEVAPQSPEKQKLRAWKRMDGKHPRYTAQGMKRIEFFRVLKKILKRYSGFGKKASYHNFVNGGGCPEDAVVGRKINRVYHKDIIVPTVAADVEQSYKRSDMEWEDGLEPKESKEEWAVFSFSADSLMRGQARKMLGLAVAIAKGLLPQNFIEVALDTSVILNLPSLPSTGLYASETKFDKWEIKFGFQVDPRRAKGADTSRMDQWTKVVRGNAIRLTKEKYGPTGDSWLPLFEEQCAACLQQHQAERSLLDRGPAALQGFLQARHDSGDTRFSELPAAHREAYANVLRLLQVCALSVNDVV
jgi:tRNA U38,U39,U40 pseudouridine synthase TruA